MEANHTVTAQQTAENVDCRVSEYKTATFANLLHDLLRGKPFSESLFPRQTQNGYIAGKTVLRQGPAQTLRSGKLEPFFSHASQ